MNARQRRGAVRRLIRRGWAVTWDGDPFGTIRAVPDPDYGWPDARPDLATLRELDRSKRKLTLWLRRTVECHGCRGEGLEPSAPDYHHRPCGGDGRLTRDGKAPPRSWRPW